MCVLSLNRRVSWSHAAQNAGTVTTNGIDLFNASDYIAGSGMRDRCVAC